MLFNSIEFIFAFRIAKNIEQKIKLPINEFVDELITNFTNRKEIYKGFYIQNKNFMEQDKEAIINNNQWIKHYIQSKFITFQQKLFKYEKNSDKITDFNENEIIKKLNDYISLLLIKEG